MNPIFLTLAQVERIHREQRVAFGGADGVRDLGALASAIAMPSAQFFGKYMHEDLFQMAAAYTFHISRNDPFVDGNKRVGLQAALVFLAMNGILVRRRPDDELDESVLKTAEGKLDKKALAEVFRKHSLPTARRRAA